MNIYSSRLCLHPLNHNHDTKEAFMCHSVPVFYVLVSIHDSFFNALQGRNETISQTLACTQTCIFRVENICNAYLHYKQTLSNAIHYTSNINSVKFAVTYRKRAHFLSSIYDACNYSAAHITTLSIPTD